MHVGHTCEKDADIPHRKIIIKRVNVPVMFRVKFESNKILILKIYSILILIQKVKKVVKMGHVARDSYSPGEPIPSSKSRRRLVSEHNTNLRKLKKASKNEALLPARVGIHHAPLN